jgi:phasin family protein
MKTMAKAKAKTGNPFLDADLGSVMDFGKLAEQFKFPGVDSEALIENQRRNLEAVTKANQVAFEGAQAVVQCQVEILRQTMDQTTKAVQAISQPSKIEDVWAKQAELLKEAYEQGFANLRALTELSAKVNAEAADLLTHRVSDSLGELKGAFTAGNGAAREATASKATPAKTGQ